MRVLRFGLFLALSGTVALGGCTPRTGNDRVALASTQTDLLVREFDQQLAYVLSEMVASAEIGPNGEVFFTQSVGDRRFLEPGSGRYWQISGGGQKDFRSRSLWNRTLAVSGRAFGDEPFLYDSAQFPDEPLRVAERTIRLPGSDVEWQFVVARSRGELD